MDRNAVITIHGSSAMTCKYLTEIIANALKEGNPSIIVSDTYTNTPNIEEVDVIGHYTDDLDPVPVNVKIISSPLPRPTTFDVHKDHKRIGSNLIFSEVGYIKFGDTVSFRDDGGKLVTGGVISINTLTRVVEILTRSEKVLTINVTDITGVIEHQGSYDDSHNYMCSRNYEEFKKTLHEENGALLGLVTNRNPSLELGNSQCFRIHTLKGIPQ